MIYWMFGAMKTAAGGDDPAGLAALLGPGEQAFYQGLRFVRRRADWLGARVALKEMALALDPRCEGLNPSQVEVLKEESGAPYLRIDGVRASGRRVSLSHSRGHALCLLGLQPSPLGADLEWIEPRDPAFAADYFTAGELAQLDGRSGEARALSETLIWSGKEAALKALATGLKRDTRSVEVTITDGNPGVDGWQPLSLSFSQAEKETLRLIWRKVGNFVLTACLPAEWAGDLTLFQAADRRLAG